MKDNKTKRILVNIFGRSKAYTPIYILGVIVVVVLIVLVETCMGMIEEKQSFNDMLLISLKNIKNTSYYEDLVVILIIVLLTDIIRFIVTIRVLTDIDLFNDKAVYRDIIYKYSPIGLAYIDDYKEDFYKYLVITVLVLQLKERININDNRIEVIDDNQYNLRESERYVLNNIRQGKIVINDTHMLKYLAKKEALEDKLLDNIESDKWRTKLGSNNLGLIKFYVGAIIGIYVFSYISFTNPILGFSLLLGISLFIVIYWLAKTVNILKTIKYPRTQLGEEINRKLEGLKNYIKEYSLLSEKEQKDLKLWKEYLIYSVMFNQNRTILNQVKKLIIFE